MIDSFNSRWLPLIGGGVVIATLAGGASAQTVLETLVVTGDRETSLASATVVAASATDLAPGVRLDPAELLQSIPGIQVDSRTNYAQDTRISLRGFGARSAFGVRGIDLQVDGIPLSTPDGQGQLSSVMLDQIERIEVLTGPVAALYGNGAGGVIALYTEAPHRSRLGVSAAAGDPGLQREAVLGEWAQDVMAARLQLAHTNIDGERPHSQAEREQGAIHLYYTPRDQLDLVFKHERSDDPLLDDPLSLTPEEWAANPQQTNGLASRFNTRKSVQHEQTSLSLRDNQGPTRWQAAVWQGERDMTQFLGFSGDAIAGSGGVVDLGRNFAGAKATLSHQFSLFGMPTDASLGWELARSEDRRRGFVNNDGLAGALRRDERGRVDSQDVHGLVQLAPISGVSLFAGVRRTRLDVTLDDYFVVEGNQDDSGERDYDETAYAFGGNYQLAEDWTLFISRGRGYETPTLTEMAYSSNAERTRNDKGFNFDLAAAVSHQTEWGVLYQPAAGPSTRLVHFAIDTQQELMTDLNVDGRTGYRNAAATEREGTELQTNYDLNDHWRLSLSAQWLDARYSAGEFDGNQLPGVAREQYSFGLRWAPWGSEAFVLNAGVQQRARVYTADNNGVHAPSYRIWELGVQGGYDLQPLHFSWWVKVLNLSDETYVGSVVVNQSNRRAFEPALGRNGVAGVKLAYDF